MRKKKIILTWDFDAFIGVVNSRLPYNYSFSNVSKEIDFVNKTLDFLVSFDVKSTFAITGFTAEEGIPPYSQQELIRDIAAKGHEVASHSWKHEWIPLFSKEQISKSLVRSKVALENTVGNNYEVTGFVPPHNKPATWIRKGAYSLEDKGLYPLFKMGNVDSLLDLLKEKKYKWVRIAHNPLINRFKKREFTRKQKVYLEKGILILENHYNGFDQKIIEYIDSKEQEYFTISAHPIMLSFSDGRPESWDNFVKFIEHFANRVDIEFVRPMDIIEKFG